MIKAADIYCGAGGTSLGAHQTGEVDIAFALNHWDVAIDTHSANFPNTKHVQSGLKWTHPSECPKINLLFASPECTHHSKARGGRPTSNQQRSGAWEIMPWLEYHRPSTLIVENVVEFESWGPVGSNGKPLKKFRGQSFDAWLMSIQSYGYRVEYQRLNAADFGAATNRNRLFIVARKGRRSIKWPTPTHSKAKNNAPLFPELDLPIWRGAIEIIDWSTEVPSVFNRKKPVADKTINRIIKGLDRYVEPFVVTLRNNCNSSNSRNPLGTITAGGRHHGLATPFFLVVNHGDSGSKRSFPAHVPLGTVTSKNGRAVVVPYLVPRHGERPGQDPRTHDINDPCPTIACSNAPNIAIPLFLPFDNGSNSGTPKDGNHPIRTITTKSGQAIALPLVMAPQSGGVAKMAMESPVPTITTMAGSQIVVPWITSFYGTQNTADLSKPSPTIPTVSKHAITIASFHDSHRKNIRTEAERRLLAVMEKLGVVDVGFRMLTNRELANAQGFGDDYIFCGTIRDITKQIGNSVSPPVAKALTESCCG